MPDDNQKIGKLGGDRINVKEPYELRDWCAHFGVTEQQLCDAVKKVGPMVADVKRHSGK